MKKDFVIRGQTASGETEILEFGGHKENYAYRLVEFSLYPSTGIGSGDSEQVGSITAGKTAIAPTDVNFNDEGLIGTAYLGIDDDHRFPSYYNSVINDTFLITQNLILMVQDTSSAGTPINWQCRFVSEKMTDAAAAVQNFRQFSIFDG